MTATTTTAAATHPALRLWAIKGSHGYPVTFLGADADAHAAAWIASKSGTHAVEVIFEEMGDVDVLASFPKSMDALYPTCHHGMDARLCMDPIGQHHFGTYAQERERYAGW